MSITVRIPTPLRGLTKDQESVEASGATIAELIEDLQGNFPGLKERICDESGELRRFVNLYLNDEDIRYLEREATPVKAGDTLSIVPSVAGGWQ